MRSVDSLRHPAAIRIGWLALTLVLAMSRAALPVGAAAPTEAPCQPASAEAPVMAAPFDQRVATLARPFQMTAWPGERVPGQASVP